MSYKRLSKIKLGRTVVGPGSCLSVLSRPSLLPTILSWGREAFAPGRKIEQDMGPNNIIRLLPDVPLPPYTYVPGQTPHPRSDPAGHLYGEPPEQPAPLDPEQWQGSRTYLRGIDLFNAGYFWEAHEVWESLWHAAGRRGATADLLKGLIKLAAAGVKLRAGVPAGVRSHAARAAAVFRRLAGSLGNGEERYLGLRLIDLIAVAHEFDERTIGDREAMTLPLIPILCPRIQERR